MDGKAEGDYKIFIVKTCNSTFETCEWMSFSLAFDVGMHSFLRTLLFKRHNSALVCLSRSLTLFQHPCLCCIFSFSVFLSSLFCLLLASHKINGLPCCLLLHHTRLIYGLQWWFYHVWYLGIASCFKDLRIMFQRYLDIGLSLDTTSSKRQYNVTYYYNVTYGKWK